MLKPCFYLIIERVKSISRLTPSNTFPLVDFAKVSKHFGSKVAVNDLSFEIQKGEIVGLLGPNGAGKSTSMKMLTGCISSSSGTIHILGKNVAETPQAAQENLGYLPENTPLYADWTVTEFLRFSAEARGLTNVREAIDQAIERSGLQAVRKQLISTLSKGYRQRTCFAQSIIHDPPLLVLDEATDGLDPNQKISMQNFIKEMKQDKGILFSTHILSEAEAICDRVLVLNSGKLVHNGDVTSLKSLNNRQRSIHLTLENGESEKIYQAFSILERIDDIEIENSSLNKTTLVITESDSCLGKDEEAFSLSIAQVAVQNGWPILDLKQETASLDTAFKELTQKA